MNPYDVFRPSPIRFAVLETVPLGALGQPTGFAGPAGMVGLTVAGAEVPADCINDPEFQTTAQAAIEQASQLSGQWDQGIIGDSDPRLLGACTPGMSRQECQKALTKAMIEQAVEDLCNYGIRSCDSASIVMEVQTALNALGANIAVDGAWGKQSQAALDKSGKTFQQLATSQCEPPVPQYVAGGGGGGGTTPGGTTPGGLTNVDYGKKTEDKGTSPWLWLGLGAVAAVGVGIVVAASANKTKDNPVGVWEHIGGGCMVGGSLAKQKYPCDDEYENSVTHERVSFDTTMDAHFSMPPRVKNISDLDRRSGVRRSAWQSADIDEGPKRKPTRKQLAALAKGRQKRKQNLRAARRR